MESENIIEINNARIFYLLSNKGSRDYKKYLEIMNFKNDLEFNQLLGKLVIFREGRISSEIFSKIEKSTKETLEICKDILGEEKLNILFFETNDAFITSKMNGSSGFCTAKNCILVLINLNSFTELTLKNTLTHELAHAINPYYDMGDMSIGQGLIFDGIAENFRERKIDNKKSEIVSKIDKEESLRLFMDIKPLLKSKNLQDYYEIFFYGKKYPLWAGYAIGYNLIRDYLQEKIHINWFNILRTNPEDILREILS